MVPLGHLRLLLLAAAVASPAAIAQVPDRPSLVSRSCAEGSPPGLRCYALQVPENRQAARSRMIELAIGVLPASGETKLPDPILYLQGGPGEAAIPDAESWAKSPLRPQRDIIFLDQRGTGGSSPLRCPEVQKAIGAAFLKSGRTPRQELTAAQDAAKACHARLIAEGYDLDGYNSIETVADIDSVRRAFAVSTWNLYGISYGTRVAQQVMREEETSLRSVVLDSGSPAGEFETVPSNLVNDFKLGLAAVARRCKADRRCNVAVPDLPAAFAAMVASYNQQPFEQVVDVGGDWGTVTVQVTGSDLVGLLIVGLKSEELAPRVPALIGALAGRNDGLVREQVLPMIVDGYLKSGGGYHGAAFSIDCADNPPRLRPRDVRLLAAADEWSSMWLGSNNAYCSVWPVKPVPSYFYETVRAEVPTLIFAGSFDPLSLPQQQTRAMAIALPNARVVEVPSAGHGPTYTNACARSVMEAFYRDPMARLADACIRRNVARFVFE